MLSREEQLELMVGEARFHVCAQGDRKRNLKWAYEAIREFADAWGESEAWCDELMIRLLNEARPSEDD